MINTVNLPLALFTIILRRFIDKLRTPEAVGIIKVATPWVLDIANMKTCMYAYMFCYGIYYTIKHVHRGTIVSWAQRYASGDTVATNNNRLRRRQPTNSTIVKNLTGDRECQQKALKYVASMAPLECVRQPTLNTSSTQNHPIERMDCPFQSEASYVTNPYFKPVDYSNRIGCGEHRRRNVEAIMGPSTSYITKPIPEYSGTRRTQNMQMGDLNSTTTHTSKADAIKSKRESSVIDLDLSDNADDLPTTYEEQRNMPKPRSTLTTRKNRRTAKSIYSNNYINSIVKKTRSGKIYGYHTDRPRRQSKRTR